MPNQLKKNFGSDVISIDHNISLDSIHHLETNTVNSA